MDEHEREEVLSLDLEEDDYLYRIRRGHRIVYVSVLHADIVPPEHRTEGSRILSHLRRLPGWDGEWRTLTVRKRDGAVECTVNEFEAHKLDSGAVDACAGPAFNLLELEFKHELEALERKVRVYGALRNREFSLCPGFIGYVYEEEKDRVLGFLMEEMHGRHPDIRDLGACEDTVEQLHGVGVVHGDLNKYNIIVSGNVAKLIDFEVSTFLEDGHHEEAKDELRKLADQLLDTSEVGLR
ncbi:hypothetical protein VF21_02982 [Pseudogymnoascus sp. 05NY08]|nr:hypothetical protein VF21_02982 [Pseudogymnoascus sp. 05NY08]